MRQITSEDLRRMSDTHGLILQGCGGDPQEWIDGINELLTEKGILLNGSKFSNAAVASFEQDGHTNLLFPFHGLQLDIGKLAIWKIQTDTQFGGTWLFDFVSNRLGGFIDNSIEPTQQKPNCPLIGADGNIFNLIGIASRTLRQNGMADEAEEMSGRITGGSCNSYCEALAIIREYVNITSGEDFDEGCDEDMEGMRLE